MQNQEKYTDQIPEVKRKIFVGGLAPSTGKASLEKYFSQFGEVVDSVIMMDRITGNSRGFAFVTFTSPEIVSAILAKTDHVIDEKKVDCKTAVPKTSETVPHPSLPSDFRTKKIFVGGLHPELGNVHLMNHFINYGRITDCIVMRDKDSGKSRGFGFVTFDNEESVERVLSTPKEHFLMGKFVECKKAQEKAALPVKAGISSGVNYSHTSFSSPISKMFSDEDPLYNRLYGIKTPSAKSPAVFHPPMSYNSPPFKPSAPYCYTDYSYPQAYPGGYYQAPIQNSNGFYSYPSFNSTPMSPMSPIQNYYYSQNIEHYYKQINDNSSSSLDSRPSQFFCYNF